MRLTKDPKFLIVQYAPGAAGKFLSSLLMCSKDVAHFDVNVEKNKTSEACIDYIKNCFHGDADNWLLTEPAQMAAWNLHFVSSKYGRGDDLTYDDFISMADADATDHFVASVNSGKLILNITHKTTTTSFYRSGKYATIFNDMASDKWYHRAMWMKLYGFKNGKVHLKMHDPRLNPYQLKYFKQFDNPMFSDKSCYNVIKNDIIKNPFKQNFRSLDNFDQSVDRSGIDLSDLLTTDRCVDAVNKICADLNISPISAEIIRKGHEHWITLHSFKYSRN